MSEQREKVLGTYSFEKDTKGGWHRFFRENGRREVQYIPPTFFNGETRPEEVEVVIRWKG
jgi:hypothetical protein